jgi:hypothetical protein
MTKTQKKLWTGLIIMALLSPLGILLPAMFNSDGAWGEWGTETLENLLGYVPEGMKKYADLWKAPVQDYNMGGETAHVAVQVISYIVSGLLGILVVGLAIYLISKVMIKNEK